MEAYNLYNPCNSVYLLFRPLLVTCKLLGCCSLQDTLSTSARGVGYRPVSIWLLLCLGIHVGLSLMTHTTTYGWPASSFFDLRKWCFLGVMLGTDRQKVEILRGLETFDLDIHSLNIPRLNKTKMTPDNLRGRGYYWYFIYQLIYLTLTTGVSVFLSFSTDITPLQFIYDLLLQATALQMVFAYTVLNLAFNDEFCWRFKMITMSWSHHLQFVRGDPLATARTLEALRLLHARLICLADHLTVCFGRFYVVNVTFAFLECLINLYHALNTERIFYDVRAVITFSVNVFSVPLLANSSHYLTIASKDILRELRKMRVISLPKTCGEQVLLFMEQLYRAPLVISGCGFFPIDRQLIGSVLVTMSTYFLVIKQMGSDLGKLTAGLLGLSEYSDYILK